MTERNSKKLGLVCTVATAFAMGLTACSSGPTQAEEQQAGTAGPTVLFARTEPGTIELNRAMQPTKTPEIVADVKDFKSKVVDVKLQFTNVPLEVPMKNIGGTTWKAEITPRQLEMLAVQGKTMKYEAQIIAKNEDGQITMSPKTVEVQVKTPQIEKTSG